MNAVFPMTIPPPGGVQLELDLFAPPEQTRSAEIIPFDPPGPEWDEQSISALRKRLLWHNLRVLADGRAGEGIKQETMDWLVSDDIEPFSFVICCSEAGYCPVTIREQTLDMLARLARRRKLSRG
jgi:hypothetical protein